MNRICGVVVVGTAEYLCGFTLLASASWCRGRRGRAAKYARNFAAVACRLSKNLKKREYYAVCAADLLYC